MRNSYQHAANREQLLWHNISIWTQTFLIKPFFSYFYRQRVGMPSRYCPSNLALPILEYMSYTTAMGGKTKATIRESTLGWDSTDLHLGRNRCKALTLMSYEIGTHHPSRYISEILTTTRAL